MRKFTKLAPITILLLAAHILRLWNVTLHELSGDEAFTIVNWTPATLNHLIQTIGTIDPQPPIALLATVAWLRLTGNTEFAARLFSILSSVILTATVYTSAARLFNTRTALLATLILVLNPYQLWFAQDVRPYAMWMATAGISTLSIISLLSTNRPTLKHFLLHTATSLLSLGVFYFQVFTIVAYNLLSLLYIRKTKANLALWVASQLFVIGTLFVTLSLTNLLSGVYKPTASRIDVFDLFPPLLLGTTWPYPSIIFPVVLTGIPFLASVLAAPNRRPTQQLLILIAIPAISLAAVTLITNQPYFRARYISSIIGPLSILLAAAITSISIKRHTFSLALLVLALLLTSSLVAINTYHFNPIFAKAPRWRQIMTLLTQNLGPNDLVIQNYPDPAFTYYYHNNADTIVLPTSENPPRNRTEDTISSLTQNHRYIWFFPTQSAAWDRDQVVSSWLETELPLINQHWVRNTHILEYAPSQPTLHDIKTPAIIEYQNILRTDGWRLSPASTFTYPNTSITLEIFYHPLQTTSQPLTFFVHLLPMTSNTPIAQSDHPPQHHADFPANWEPELLLRDIFTLQIPTTAEVGTYRLVFGLYNPITNTRYLTTSPLPSNDSTLITTISINDNKKRDAP